MLNMLKDPAKRAEWVYGQPMAPCPKCGSYNMKPQIPIAMETSGAETMPQLVGKWARATKAGSTPLQGPAYYCCWDCHHKGPAVDCTGRTSEECRAGWIWMRCAIGTSCMTTPNARANLTDTAR